MSKFITVVVKLRIINEMTTIHWIIMGVPVIKNRRAEVYNYNKLYRFILIQLANVHT